LQSCQLGILYFFSVAPISSFTRRRSKSRTLGLLC